MAESSKQSAGLDKQLLGAKNEPGKESKRKRKRNKKPARAQSNESLESQMKNQEGLACDEQNVGDNSEDSKLNTKGTSQTVLASDTSGTANISEELNPPDNEKMTKEETTQGHVNHEECTNKDVQQDLQTIQEQASEERESKSEQTKQDHASNKKGKFAFHRSKKVKSSMSKSPADEDKHQSDPSGETTTVNPSTVEGNTKTAEQQVYKAGGAKLQTSASSADNENEEASTLPEGIQEKPLSKSNKGKKLKQLASFGRNKKKYEIALKLDETSTETHEGNLVDTPGKFERSRGTSSPPFQATEITGNESKEPVAVDSSDFINENTNDGKDNGTEIEKKRGGKHKKKESVLGFKRSKPQPKRKPSKSEDELNTGGGPSKESDDVSATKSGEMEKNNAEFEESNEDSKGNETEAVVLKTEETSGAVTEMSQEVSNKQETMNAENQETVTTAHEDSNQVTPKKEKKENILRRRLRKLKSPGNIFQGRKKSPEDEKSVEGTGDGLNRTDPTDTRASSELEQTAEEQTPVAEDNVEEECSDQEGTSKAVKRKTSDLKTTTRALKKMKEDGENIIGAEDNEKISGTALAIVKEKDDQNIYEEVNLLNDLETVKEVKDLTEKKEQSVDERNEEMPQQENVMEEHEESKQSEVDEEISRESLAYDDTKTEEELSKEARRKSQKLMQTVINELTELLKKKEEKKAAEIAIQAEEREERVEFSDRENAVTANQQLTSALDDTGREHEPEEDSYDSDVTVVTVERLSSDESLVEHKTEPNAEDEIIRPIVEEVLSESETPRGVEPPVENESKRDTKEEEVPLETKTPQVTQTREKQENEPNTEDKETDPIIEEISKEAESVEPNIEIEELAAIPEEVSSETEAPRDAKLQIENDTKQETEDKGVISFTEEVSSGTEISAANNDDSQVEPVHVPKKLTAEPQAEHKTEPSTEGEEVHDINEAGESSETEPNPEDSTVEAVNIKPEELMPESRAGHDTEPGTEGEDVKDFSDASESSKTRTSIVNRKGSKSKGRIAKVKVLKNESKVGEDSDELETITKANELDERKEDEDEQDAGQSKEDSCLMESYQAPSCQDSVEEWILVHRVDLTQEISRQIKHSLVFNSLRRSYTSCCTIM